MSIRSSDVNDWTLDECRDWLAKDDGWVKVKDHHGSPAWRHKELIHDATSNWSHPHPTTLDAAAASLPKGWKIRTLYQCDTGWVCSAMRDTATIRGVVDVPTELLARFRLACEARMADVRGDARRDIAPPPSRGAEP